MALIAAFGGCETTEDPFPEPISTSEGVIEVRYVEFASIPDIDGTPARMMTLVSEPRTRRIFVSDMRGPIYGVSQDGRTVTTYLDVGDARWGVDLNASDNDVGVQSFALHPQFAMEGAPGYGKLYTWIDSHDTEPPPDFVPSGRAPFLYRGAELGDAGDSVLLEWNAVDPTASGYDGGAPREILRVQQPFGNHNGGHIAFAPAPPGAPDFGLLYVGVADGGSANDPFGLSQSLNSVFGKILRIDPLGTNSANGEYGVPDDNAFAADDDPDTLGEIYAYGVRNPHRFAWDPLNGNLFLADVGENTVEEIDLVTTGANLGWNRWEGGFRFLSNSGLSFVSRALVSPSRPRSDRSVTYPVVEYDHVDPLLQSGSAAVTGVHVYRGDAVPQLRDLLVFGDLPSGELFYVHADSSLEGGQDAIRRVLLSDGGQARPLLEIIQEKNAEQGRTPANRVDLRFGTGPDGQLLLLNKADGVIRAVVR